MAHTHWNHIQLNLNIHLRFSNFVKKRYTSVCSIVQFTANLVFHSVSQILQAKIEATLGRDQVHSYQTAH